MASTNKTPNYNLPQWVGSDHPTWQGDLNTAFLNIDNALQSQQSEIDSILGSDEVPAVTYFVMTCDLWDYGTVAAKESEDEEQRRLLNSQRNRRY